MSVSVDMPRGRRGAAIAGRILSGATILFLACDAAIKLMAIGPVTATMAQLGWPDDAGTARILGALLAIVTLLYALPATALLGAILLTGYLGGAVAAHVRIASPLFTHVLFGVYLGLFAWGGLWLRDPRFRAMMPLRRG